MQLPPDRIEKELLRLPPSQRGRILDFAYGIVLGYIPRTGIKAERLRKLLKIGQKANRTNRKVENHVLH